MYEEYVKKIKRIASVKNFIVRFRILISSVTLVLVGLLTAFLVSKGHVSSITLNTTNLEYGEKLEYRASSLFSDVYFEFLVDGAWTKEEPKVAGTYEIRAVSKGAFSKKYSDSLTYVISKKDLTINVNENQTITYGSMPSVSYDGLIDGDKIVLADILFNYEDLTKSSTNVGISSLKVVNSEGVDVTDSYNLLNEKTSITFNKYNALISINEENKLKKEYDGESFDVTNLDNYNISSLPYGDTLVIKDYEIYNNAGEVVDKAITPGKYTYKILDYKFENNGNDTSINYNFNYDTLIGSFEITKRKISVETSSKSKVYDGSVLESASLNLTSASNTLVSGNTLTYDTSKTTSTKYFKEGGVSNVLTPIILDKDGKDITNYYDIDITYGTLKIEKYSGLKVETSSNTWVYDGLTKSDKKITYTNTLGSDKVKVTGEITTLTDVGSISNKLNVLVYNDNLTSEENILLNNSYSIDDSNFNYGTLSVTKKSVFISLDEDFISTYTYDGLSHLYDNTKYTLDIGSLYNGSEEISLNIKYIKDGNVVLNPTNVGSYLVYIDSLNLNTLASNNYDFNVSTTPLSLNILKRDIEININDLEETYKNINYKNSVYKSNSYTISSTLNSINGNNTFIQSEEILSFDINKFNFKYIKYASGNTYSGESLEPINAGYYEVTYDINDIITSSLFDNNYNLVSINQGIFNIKKLDIEIKMLDDSKVYDGIAYEYNKGYVIISDYNVINGSSSLLSSDEIITISSYNVLQNNTFKTPINAGSYELYIKNINYTPKALNNYNINISNTPGILTIEKLDISITLDSLSAVYNNTDYSNNIYKYNSYTINSSNESINGGNTFIQSGETLRLNTYKFIFNSTPINAGTYIVSYNVSDVVGSSLFTNNYNLTEVREGIFEITKVDITIVGVDEVRTYDGLEYVYDKGYIIESDNLNLNGRTSLLNSNDLITITSYSVYKDGIQSSLLNVGSYKLYITSFEANDGALNNYNISISEDPCNITINKLNISLLLDDMDDIIYDGNAHYYDSSKLIVSYTKDGEVIRRNGLLRSDESLDVSFLYYLNSSEVIPTNVGTYTIRIKEVILNDLAKNNYDVDYSYTGKLNIIKRNITIKLVDQSKEYDGKVYTYDTKEFYVVDDNLIEGKRVYLLNEDEYFISFNISYTIDDEVLSPLNAGKYNMIINTYTASSLLNKNYNLSFDSAVLNITRKQISASLKNIEKVYNGISYAYDSSDVLLSANGQEFIPYNSLEKIDSVVISYSLSDDSDTNNPLYVGIYYMRIIEIKGNELFENNYILSYSTRLSNNTLTITKADITLSLKNSAYNKTYDGNSYEISLDDIKCNFYLESESVVSIDAIYYNDGNEVTPIHKGSYTFKVLNVELNDLAKRNYNLKISNDIYNLNIKARNISINTTLDKYTFTYGDDITYKVSYSFNNNINNLVSGDSLKITSYTITKDGKEVEVLNAGVYSVLANLKLVSNFSYDSDYNIIIKEATLTVNRREIKVVLKDFSVVFSHENYKGKVLTNNFTLYDGDILLRNNYIDKYTTVSSVVIKEINNNDMISAGTYDIKIEYVNYTDTNKNYKFTYEDSAKLTITKLDLNVVLKSATGENGFKYTSNTFDTSNLDSLVSVDYDGAVLDLTYILKDLDGNVLESVVGPGSYKYNIDTIKVLLNDNGIYNDYTSSFNIKEVDDAFFDIIGVKVNITLKDINKVYDGKSFLMSNITSTTNNYLTITSDSNIDNILAKYPIKLNINYIKDEITYKSPIHVGVYDLSVDSYEVLNIDNDYFYDISITDGSTLTITKASYTFVGSYSKTFDKESFTKTLSQDLMNNDTVTYTVYYDGDIINNGTYNLSIKDIIFSNNNEYDYDITYDYNIIVNKVEFNISTDISNLTYDGKVKTINSSNFIFEDKFGFNVIIEDFSIQGINTKDTKILNADTYKVSITSFSVDDYDTKNFLFNDVDITLNKADINITLEDDTITYNKSKYTYNGSISIKEDIDISSFTWIYTYYDSDMKEIDSIFHAGTYYVGVSGYIDNNYPNINNFNTISQTKASIIVNKYDITLKPDDMEYTYGPTNKYPTTSSCVVENTLGDEFVFDIYYTKNNKSVTPSDVGTYQINIRESNIIVNDLESLLSDYNISLDTSTLTINKLVLNATLSDISIAYKGEIDTKVKIDDTYYLVMDYSYKQDGLEVTPLHVGSYDIVVNSYKIYANNKEDNLDNYKIDIVNKNNTKLTITPLDFEIKLNDDSKVYDGLSYSYSVVPYTFKNDTITYEVLYNESTSKPLHAGKYKMTATNFNVSGEGNDSDYNFTSTDSILTINKKDVSIGIKFNTDSNVRTYDDTKTTISEKSIEGLIDGDSITLIYSNGSSYKDIQYVLRYSDGSIKKYYISIKSYKIGSKISYEADYNVTLDGIYTYTINPIKLNVETMSNTFYYSGINLYYFNYDLNGDIITGQNHKAKDNYNLSITNVGTYENKFSIAIFSDDTDLTFNYDISYSYGSIEVIKRFVTIKTNTSVGTYDQSSNYYDKSFDIVSNDTYDDYTISYLDGRTYTINPYGLLSDDIITVSKYAKVKTVDDGEVSNVLEVTIKNQENKIITNNYDIEYEYGTISVKKLKLTGTLNLKKETDVYDSNVKNVLKVTYKNESGKTYSFSSDVISFDYVILKDGSVVSEIKNAGSYNISIDLDTINVTRKDIDMMSNYDISFDTYEVSYEITKKDLVVTTNGNRKIYDGLDFTYLKFITSGLCENDSVEVDYLNSKESEYTIYAYDNDGNAIKSASQENKFSVKVVDNNGNDVSSSYNITYEYGTIKVYDKISSIDVGSSTYDGTLVSIGSSDSNGNYFIAYVDSYTLKLYYDGIYTDTSYQEEASIINVGTYYLKINKDKSSIIKNSGNIDDITLDILLDDECTAKYSVHKRNIVIKPLGYTWTYDGNSHYLSEDDYLNDTSYISTDLLTSLGHYAKIVTSSGFEATKIGTTKAKINGVSIYDSLGNDITYNYNVIYDTKTINEYASRFNDSTKVKNALTKIINVTINLEAKEISMTSESMTWTYDGKAHSYTSGMTYDKTALLSGDTLEILEGLTITNVGTKSNKVQFKVTNALGEDVTKCYEGYYGENNINLGSLEVTKREITITTISYSAKSTGSVIDPSLYKSASLTSGELVSGDYIDFANIEYTLDNSNTAKVGEYQNKISKSSISIYYDYIDASGNERMKNVTSNYNITVIYGSVVIS